MAMTYNDGIKYFQDSLEGRIKLGEIKNQNVETLFQTLGRRCTLKEFEKERDKQMRKVYSHCQLEARGSHPLYNSAGSNLLDAWSPILGEKILITSTEIGFIQELVEKLRGNSFSSDKVKVVVDNMVALQTALKEKTGKEVYSIPLCRETDALNNEINLAARVWDRDAHESSLPHGNFQIGPLKQLWNMLKVMARSPGEPVKFGEQEMPLKDDR